MTPKEIGVTYEAYRDALAARRRIDSMWGIDWPSMMSGQPLVLRRSWSASTVVHCLVEAGEYAAILREANARLGEIIG